MKQKIKEHGLCVCSKSREVGLVVPGRYKAMTQRKEIINVLSCYFVHYCNLRKLTVLFLSLGICIYQRYFRARRVIVKLEEPNG